MMIVVWGLLGLGLIVFIHEAGHFIAAKLCGVGVTTFSLGWGKKLIGFTHKGTTYQIAWFPIGGYCKMKGEMQAPENLDQEAFHKMLNEPGSYLAAAWWKKIFISIAGPLANILFAILVFTVISLVGSSMYSAENRIILAPTAGETSAAQEAGLETGDKIVELNGKPVYFFEQLAQVVRKSAGLKLRIKVERKGKLFDTILIPKLSGVQGKMGVYGWADPIIQEIDESSLWFKGGLRQGDRIVALNRQAVTFWIDYYLLLGRRPASVELVILRDNRFQPLNFSFSSGDDSLYGGIVFFKKYRTPDMHIGSALWSGVEQSAEIVTLTVKGFALLFKADKAVLKDSVAGPIGITKLVGEITLAGFKESLAEGFLAFFRLVCTLSVVVAFMNMLPIPALDGGQVILSIYMKLAGKRLTPKFLFRYQAVGYFIVLSLLTIAVFSDIFNLFG